MGPPLGRSERGEWPFSLGTPKEKCHHPLFAPLPRGDP